MHSHAMTGRYLNQMDLVSHAQFIHELKANTPIKDVPPASVIVLTNLPTLMVYVRTALLARCQ